MSKKVDTSDCADIRKLARTFRLNASACDGVVNKDFSMRFTPELAEALARVLEQSAQIAARKAECDRVIAEFMSGHRGLQISRARWRARLAERRGLCVAWFLLGVAVVEPLGGVARALAGLLS